MDHADFFVSYTSVDERWAVWISHVLEDAGFTVKVQAWDFRPGSNFVVEMHHAARTCKRVIAVLSPDYLTAQFPTPEWAAAFAGDPEGLERKLVPIMVRECRPDGLLAPIVQIRIHDVDQDEAVRRILDGVNARRAKPAAPPEFPGTGPATTPTGSAAASVANPASAVQRLPWRRTTAPHIVWRSDTDRASQGFLRSPMVELHLAPVGDDAALQVTDLRQLEHVLPEHGRRHKLFTAVEALAVGATTDWAYAGSTNHNAGAGIAVTRAGQRTAWAPLPRDTMGAMLDEAHLVGQLQQMLLALIALRLPPGDLVVPAIGIEPAAMISIGKVGGAPRSSASYGHRSPQRIRPRHDSGLPFTTIEQQPRDVCTELAARLLAEHHEATGLR